MQENAISKKIENLVTIGLVLVTLFVSQITNIDQINVPKLMTLLIVAMAVLGLFLSKPAEIIKQNKTLAILIFLFIGFFFVSLLISDAPMNQQIFGAYGRNTGFLAYFAFSILIIAASNFTTTKMYSKLSLAVLITFSTNTIFSLLQYFGIDPFDWDKPYSPITGTLGNPNFVSAFLGMGIGFALAMAVSSKIKTNYRIWASFISLLALFVIIRSNSIQGLIVVMISISIIVFFLIKSRLNKPNLNLIYLGVLIIGGLISILGMLQRGPLASVFYKPSVTYRGDYWRAGLGMIQDNPFFGVGLDSYGDWYRKYRSIEAIIRRGPTAVTDSAHNVYLDIATTAGSLALLMYLGVLTLGMRAAWKISKMHKSYDPIFVAIFVMWVGYLAQAFISINNLALGIWGWVLPGILIAMEKQKTLEVEGKNYPTSFKTHQRIDFSSMFMSSGLIIGAIVGYFPMNADINFKHALLSGNSDKIIEAVYKWPTSTNRYLYSMQVYSDNKLEEIAINIGRDALKENPRSFNAWLFLYNSEKIKPSEKAEILKTLKELDPNNPDLTKLG